MTRHLFHLIPIAFLATVSLLLYSTTKPHQAVSITLTEEAQVSAAIGVPLPSLFGYTSAGAVVYLDSTPIAARLNTTSGSDGYFEFKNIYVHGQTKEFCLTSQDHSGRSTNPVCIPSPDLKNRTEPIGPVILPPTISIDRQFFLPHETVETSGETIPNTTLTISLFRAEPTIFERLPLSLLPLPKPVLAAALPFYTVTTDSEGYFSFNLPSNLSNTFRIFSQTSFEDSPSPKSNTLSFKVLTFWEYLLTLLLIIPKLILEFLKKLPFLDLLLIIQTLILLIYFLSHYLHRKLNKYILVLNNDIKPYQKNYLQTVNQMITLVAGDARRGPQLARRREPGKQSAPGYASTSWGKQAAGPADDKVSEYEKK